MLCQGSNYQSCSTEKRNKDGVYAFDSTQLQLPASFQHSTALNSYNYVVSSDSILCNSVFGVENLSVVNGDVSRNNAVFTLWHNRLGHVSDVTVKTMLSKCNVYVPSNKGSISLFFIL